jgi:A/G-specific adenine glycosylase
MMELGATVCLPRTPQCLLCPLREHCAARELGLQNELPVKLRRRKPVKLAVELLLIEKGGRILMRQRSAQESQRGAQVAQPSGFWELPEGRLLPDAPRIERLGVFRHSITHHDYTIEVWSAAPVKAPRGFRWIDPPSLASLPLATTARKALSAAGRTIGEPAG